MITSLERGRPSLSDRAHRAKGLAGRRRLAAMVEEKRVLDAVRGHRDCRFVVMDRDPMTNEVQQVAACARSVQPEVLASLSTSDTQHALALSLMLLQRDPEAAIESARAEGRPTGIAALTSVALAWRCLGESGRACETYLRIAIAADHATKIWSLLNASAFAVGTTSLSIRFTLEREIGRRGPAAARTLIRPFRRVVRNRREEGFELGELHAQDERLIELSELW